MHGTRVRVLYMTMHLAPNEGLIAHEGPQLKDEEDNRSGPAPYTADPTVEAIPRPEYTQACWSYRVGLCIAARLTRLENGHSAKKKEKKITVKISVLIAGQNYAEPKWKHLKHGGLASCQILFFPHATRNPKGR